MYNVVWAKAYLRAKWHLDPASHLATTDMGRKLGAVPLWGGGAGSPSNTMWPEPRPTSVPSGILMDPAVWPHQIWAKNWGLCPLFGGKSWVSSNTMWPGPRPTSLPSFVLIPLTVWPQYTNVTGRTDMKDRQDRTDNGPVAWGEQFYKRSPKNR